MPQTSYILLIILTHSACSFISNPKQDTAAKNKNLLGFKSTVLAEFGDDKYDALEQKLAQNNMEITYLHDIIYVSYLEELNACGKYDGNLVYSGDTIKLKVDLVSDEVCTSTSLARVTFLINNPNEKRKQIVKD